MQKREILFVINPISGGKSKGHLPKLIQKHLNHELYNSDIFWWEQVEGLYSKIELFIASKGDVIVAVGGDGTVNLVCNAICNTQVAMVIFPMGSGNGLARQLGFMMSTKKSIDMLNAFTPEKIQEIDLAFANEVGFVNIAGIGFDAQVSHVFAKMKQRGFWSYAKAVLKLFVKTKNQPLILEIDGKQINRSCFMLSVANGSQWGNNFFIAHVASLSDGMLDVVVVEKPTISQIPGFIWSLRMGMDHKCMTLYRGSNINIQMHEKWPLHLDGEPHDYTHQLSCSVLRNAIRVVDFG